MRVLTYLFLEREMPAYSFVLLCLRFIPSNIIVICSTFSILVRLCATHPLGHSVSLGPCRLERDVIEQFWWNGRATETTGVATHIKWQSLTFQIIASHKSKHSKPTKCPSSRMKIDFHSHSIEITRKKVKWLDCFGVWCPPPAILSRIHCAHMKRRQRGRSQTKKFRRKESIITAGNAESIYTIIIKIHSFHSRFGMRMSTTKRLH